MGEIITPLSWLSYDFKTGRSHFFVAVTYIIAVMIISSDIRNGKSAEDGCYFLCKNNRMWDAYVQMFRGDDYYVVASKDKEGGDVNEESYRNVAKNCPVTTWGLLHFTLYLILGFLCPKFFWPLFVIGIGWELYESLFMRCHCTMDIAWNFTGLLVGWSLRNYLFPYNIPPKPL